MPCPTSSAGARPAALAQDGVEEQLLGDDVAFGGSMGQLTSAAMVGWFVGWFVFLSGWVVDLFCCFVGWLLVRWAVGLSVGG